MFSFLHKNFFLIWKCHLKNFLFDDIPKYFLWCELPYSIYQNCFILLIYFHSVLDSFVLWMTYWRYYGNCFWVNECCCIQDVCCLFVIWLYDFKANS
jgi:hypothetical protein